MGALTVGGDANLFSIAAWYKDAKGIKVNQHPEAPALWALQLGVGCLHEIEIRVDKWPVFLRFS